MWIFKEKPIIKQIKEYNKDLDYLFEFAKYTQKQRIEEITHEDIKSFYKEVVERKESQWQRNTYMLALRKFFRIHRGKNIIKASNILNNPLQIVESNDKVVSMETIEKKTKGNPKNKEAMKKVSVMYDELGLTFREISKALNKDVRQVHLWYQYSHPEKYLKKC